MGCLLSILSFIWGILAVLGMAVAFIPFLGSLNYLNIPFAVFGLLFSILVIVLSSKKRARYLWVCPLCYRYFFRCYPAGLRFRYFLIHFHLQKMQHLRISPAKAIRTGWKETAASHQVFGNR